MHKERIQKLQSYLRDQKADGILITNPYNILYLSGFIGISTEERESTMFVTLDHAYLFVPAMYELKAKSSSPKWDSAIELVVDAERGGLLTLFARYSTGLKNIIGEADDLHLAEYERIQKNISAKLVPQSGVVERLRLIKDHDELATLRYVTHLTEAVFQDLVHYLQGNDYTQLTELDIADMMRTLGREKGADGFSFDPIVACGPGSAEPHYVTSSRRFVKGQPLLMDFGYTYKGYCSDLTRTVFLGEPDARFRSMYALVLEANQVGLASMSAGKTEGEVYGSAYDCFVKNSVQRYFIHGLGHGVGLQVHEAPYARAGSKTILQPGMTLTIEPGLYFENEWGIRIEDLAVVTEAGCEILSVVSERKLVCL